MFTLFAVFFLWFIIFFLMSVYYGSVWNNLETVYSKNVWLSSFECGFVGYPLSFKNFSVTFFMFLVFFVMFDLEVSLLLKMPFQFTYYKKFTYYLIFMLMLVLGYLVEVLKGFTKWGV